MLPLRVADLAARSLAAACPKRYAFAVPEDIAERDRAIERIRDVGEDR